MPRWKLLCPTVTYALAVLVAIIGCILSSVQYGGIQQSLLNVYNAPGQFAISGISVVQDVQNGVQAINKDITTLIDTTIPPKIETIKVWLFGSWCFWLVHLFSLGSCCAVLCSVMW